MLYLMVSSQHALLKSLSLLEEVKQVNEMLDVPIVG